VAVKILVERYRKKRKLTQAQLAKLSGVPQPMISMIESKAVPNPTIGTICKLAAAMKCTVDDLIEEE
jgi:transcriptional regulator with XRE-family HTH domain